MHRAYAVFVTSVTFLVGCRTTQNEGRSTTRDAESSVDVACVGFSEAPGEPVAWLKGLSQAQLARVFDCAPESTTTPLGFGKGVGTLYQTWPLWSDLQTSMGRLIWGGKRFFKDGDDTLLLNKMIATDSERYKAQVVIGPSLRDGRPTVILDYRNDASVATLGPSITPPEAIVDQIVRGIRDEIREIRANGQGSDVYIGRAYILNRVFRQPLGTLGEKLTIGDAEFQDPNAFMFAANFFLDFRGR